MKAADAVRVLGVLFTPDLTLDKHAATVSAKCFFPVEPTTSCTSLTDRESAATLVHAFVSSRIDYGNALFANATKSTTDKLQRSSTLPHELFPAHGNLIGDCHASFVMTYTG